MPSTPIYATPDDLRAWRDGRWTDGAERYLRLASMLVTRATRRCVYATTLAGTPSDRRLAGVFEEATCIQAAYWADLDEQAKEAASQPATEPAIKTATFGSTRVEYAAVEAPVAVPEYRDTLCPEALLTLSLAVNLHQQPRLAYRGWRAT